MDLRRVSNSWEKSKVALLVLILTASCLLQGCGGLRGGGQLAPHKLQGSHQIMSPKLHGSCIASPQNPLRWGVDRAKADELGCFNRHLAEFPGSWESTELPGEIANRSAVENSTIMFYDSVTGRPLFEAPKGRTWSEFHRESTVHGWPSFRDDEVIGENVRVLADGEVVSLAGPQLGFNVPNRGNRYQINVVSIAGKPNEPNGPNRPNGPNGPNH